MSDREILEKYEDLEKSYLSETEEKEMMDIYTSIKMSLVSEMK